MELGLVLTGFVSALFCLLAVKWLSVFKSGQLRWVGLGFVITLFLFLLQPLLYRYEGIWQHLPRWTTAAIPSLNFILMRLFFEDSRPLWKTSLGYAWFLFVVDVFVYLYDHRFILSPELSPLIDPFHKILILLPYVFILYITLKGLRTDLVSLRLKLRYWVFVPTTLLICGVIFSDRYREGYQQLDQIDFLVISCLASILIFLILSLSLLEKISESLHDHNSSPRNPSLESYDELEQMKKTLLHWMMQNKSYREEGLTLSDLSLQLGFPVYKLRECINRKLAYRNFNDFLNFYRIEEAKVLLLDPRNRDRKILAIAFDVGFSSLSPFNRAFKAQTGLTPSEFRKNGPKLTLV